MGDRGPGSAGYRNGGDYRGGRGRGSYSGDFHGGGGRGRGRDGDDRGGNKRKRESDAFDVDKHLLQRLIQLGDQGPESPPVEEQVRELAAALRHDLTSRGEKLQDDLLECCCQLSYKMHVYALLIGLLNCEDYNWVEGLLRKAAAQFDAAAAAGERLPLPALLRLFAALVPVNVLLPSAAAGALAAVLRAATLAAEAATAGAQPARLWQPYGDWLVRGVLLALAWGGGEVAGEEAGLMQAAEAYMQLRPRATQPSLCPFFEPLGDDDAAAASDGGGAGLLTDLCAAARECADSDGWRRLGFAPVAEPFQQKLSGAEPHELPALAVPAEVPGMPAGGGEDEAAAWLLARYPPRGGVRLLALDATCGERPVLARVVGSEMMIDVLEAFDGERVEAALRLSSGLPLTYKYEHLLAETMFGQLLRTPRGAGPPPLFVGSCMVDLCKLMATFPRSMSACVRQLFARCATTYPELEVRLAEWLAFHLSNFELMWPWDKWAHVLQAPRHDAQRRFCVAVLSRLMRLSYYERVHASLPESFYLLLPPKPEPAPLPPPLAPEGGGKEGGGEGGGDVDMGGGEGGPGGEGDEESSKAAEVVAMVRSKTPLEALGEWVDASAASHSGGAPSLLRALVRGMLTAGAKSFTHMLVVLERYHALLERLACAAGRAGEVAMVEAASAVWAAAPQRMAMAADRLLALRLVEPEAVVEWVFERSSGARSAGDELAAGGAYEVLAAAVDKAVARALDAREEAAAAAQALQSARAEAAAAETAAADARRQADDAMAAVAAAGEEAGKDADVDGGVAGKETEAAGDEAGEDADMGGDEAGAEAGSAGGGVAAGLAAAAASGAAAGAAAERCAAAAARSAEAAAAVGTAEEAAAAKREAAAAAEREQWAVIVAVARGFAGLLAGGEDGAGALLSDVFDDEAERGAAAAAWHKLTTARLAGFLRSYHVQAAGAAGTLRQEVFGDESLPEPVRAAALAALEL